MDLGSPTEAAGSSEPLLPLARLHGQLRGHQNVERGAYIILYYIILYYTIRYYTILYYTILYYTIRGVPLGHEAWAGRQALAVHTPPDRSFLVRSGISIVVSESFLPITRSRHSWD